MTTAILSQAEIAELRRIFAENTVLKSALAKFCAYQQEAEALQCKTYLLGSYRNVDTATTHAAGAACYEAFMGELRQFLKEQIERSA